MNKVPYDRFIPWEFAKPGKYKIRKQSLQDKKNGVWHYDIYYNDLRTFIDHQAPIEEIIAHSLKTWKVSTMFKEICRRQNMPIKTWDDNHREHSRKFSKLDETYVKMRKIA